MAQPILLKRSSVAGKAPTTANLQYGELSINYTDGALYYLTSNNTIGSFLANGTSYSANVLTSNSIVNSGSITTASATASGNITAGNITSTGTLTIKDLVVTGNSALTNFTSGNTNLNVTPGTFYVNIAGSTIMTVTSAGLQMYAPMSMGGYGISGLATPTTSDGAANKGYADGAAGSGSVPSGDLGSLAGSQSQDAFGQSITPYTLYDCSNTPNGSIQTADFENTTGGANYVAKNPI